MARAFQSASGVTANISRTSDYQDDHGASFLGLVNARKAMARGASVKVMICRVRPVGGRKNARDGNYT
jgi:hypothetical protein